MKKNNNRLIAEFMGLVEDETYKKIDIERKEKGLFVGEPMYQKDSIITNLRYDFSWDWLMAVVEKIESLKYEIYIVKSTITINKFPKEIIKIDNLDNNKLEATYIAIIQFIKWYNKQIN